MIRLRDFIWEKGAHLVKYMASNIVPDFFFSPDFLTFWIQLHLEMGGGGVGVGEQRERDNETKGKGGEGNGEWESVC